MTSCEDASDGFSAESNRPPLSRAWRAVGVSRVAATAVVLYRDAYVQARKAAR